MDFRIDLAEVELKNEVSIGVEVQTLLYFLLCVRVVLVVDPRVHFLRSLP